MPTSSSLSHLPLLTQTQLSAPPSSSPSKSRPPKVPSSQFHPLSVPPAYSNSPYLKHVGRQYPTSGFGSKRSSRRPLDMADLESSIMSPGQVSVLSTVGTASRLPGGKSSSRNNQQQQQQKAFAANGHRHDDPSDDGDLSLQASDRGDDLSLGEGSTTSTVRSAEIFKPYYKALALSSSSAAGGTGGDGSPEGNKPQSAADPHDGGGDGARESSAAGAAAALRPGGAYLDLLLRIEGSSAGGGGGDSGDDASTAGMLSVASNNTHNHYDDLLYNSGFAPIGAGSGVGGLALPSVLSSIAGGSASLGRKGAENSQAAAGAPDEQSIGESTTAYDDPTVDTPVGVSVYLRGPATQYAQTSSGLGSPLIGKMVVMKSTSLSKLRRLIKTHCRQFLPPSFVFVDATKTSVSFLNGSASLFSQSASIGGVPASANASSHLVSVSSEASIIVYDVCRFQCFDNSGVACVEVYIRQPPAPLLPFSRCSSFEDYLKMNKDQTLRLQRMAAAEQTGAVAALRVLDTFVRKFQYRISDAFVLDGQRVSALSGAELQKNLKSVRCYLTPDAVSSLVSFLDDRGVGEVQAKELEEALRHYRRSQKATKGTNAKGIYVASSINLTRKAVKRLSSAGGDGPNAAAEQQMSPRTMRRAVVLTPIGNPARSWGGVESIATTLESVSAESGGIQPVFDDYVEQMSSVGGGDSTINPDVLSYVEDVQRAGQTISPSKQRSSRRGKKHRPKVRRFEASDSEIESILDSLFPPSSIECSSSSSDQSSSRISFTEFLDSIKSNSSDPNAAKLYQLLAILRDEWAKEEALSAVEQLGDVPTLSNEDIDKVIHFIKATSPDTGTNEINCRELEEAFRIIKRQSAADELTPGVVSSMKIMINRMRRKKLKLNDLFKELDKSGDGIVSHSEIADWLSTMGVGLDNINAVLKYLDPANDGELETAELANALRKAEITVNHMDSDEKEKELVLLKVAQADAAVKKVLAMQPEGFTQLEIEMLSSFLDPSGDGDITMVELEASFRKARRGRAERPLVEEGKKLLVKLRTMLRKSNIDLNDWYETLLPPILTFDYDIEKAAKRSLSTKDLRVGLIKLSDTSGSKGFNESEILKLVRYMDPSGEGDISSAEMIDAFDRVDKVSDAERIELEVGGTLIRIEQFMKDKGMRLQDFFTSLDKSGKGAVTIRDLADWLAMLSEPSGAVKALMKRRDEALDLQEQEQQLRNEAMRIINERIKFAEESGAAEVLHTLERCMKEKGLRLTDLFREIDKDGSGLVSPAELRLGMKLMSEPKGEAVAPLRRAREKARAQKQEMIRKMMEAQRFEDKVAAAGACGATEVILKLESFMRRKQLRVKDLFGLLNKSGNETATVAELHRALAKARLNIPIEEIERMIRFMDTSGDMEIDRNELEIVITDFRRFAYEQQNRHMISAKKLPLSTLYASLGSVFSSTDVVLGKYSRGDIAFALRRLRGDIAMPPTSNTLTEEDCQFAVDALSRLHGHVEAIKAAENIDPFLAFASAESTVSLADLKAFMTKVSSEPIIPKRKKHVKLKSTARLPPSITDENIDQICKFVDPNSKGLNVKDLEAAFRRVWKASSYTAIDADVVTGMKGLMDAMRTRKLSLDAVLASAPKGRVTREMMQTWLSAYNNIDENSISVLIKYVDPDNSDSLSSEDIDQAFRKAYVFVCRKELLDSRAKELALKAEAAEKALRTASETPKLVFSDAEVDQIVAHLDPTNSGRVEIAGFESAFRKARRAQGVDGFLQKAKDLARRLSDIVSAKGWSVQQFVEKFSTSVSGQLVGGVITQSELKNCLMKTLKYPEGFLRFTHAEVVNLIRFLDPNGEGNMTAAEISTALSSLDEPAPANELTGETGKTLGKLERFMKEKCMRLTALIATCSGVEEGEGADGQMSSADLKAGLRAICAPSPALKRLVLARDEAMKAKAAEEERRRVEEEELNGKVKALEESGTATVMRAVNEIMIEKGLRLAALFNEIDREGTGMIKKEELKGHLVKLIKASDSSKIALAEAAKKAKDESNKRAAEEEKKKKLAERMDRARADGTLAAVDRVIDILRSRQLRIRDLVVIKNASSKSKFRLESKIRKGAPLSPSAKEEELGPESEEAGVGQIVAGPAEMLAMLRAAERKAPVTQEDIEAFFIFAEESCAGGNGKLTLDDFDAALAEYKRFLWDKQTAELILRSNALKEFPPMFTRREVSLAIKALNAAAGNSDSKTISLDALRNALERSRQVMATEGHVLPLKFAPNPEGSSPGFFEADYAEYAGEVELDGSMDGTTGGPAETMLAEAVAALEAAEESVATELEAEIDVSAEGVRPAAPAAVTKDALRLVPLAAAASDGFGVSITNESVDFSGRYRYQPANIIEVALQTSETEFVARYSVEG